MKTKEITKEWLQEKEACLSSLTYVCENGYIGLSITAFINKLIKNDRVNDANWLITQYMNKKQNIKYTIFVAQQELLFFEKEHPNDKRPRKAIQAAKEYLKNPCKKTKKRAYTAYYAVTYTIATSAIYAIYTAITTNADYAAAYAAYAAYAVANAAAANAADSTTNANTANAAYDATANNIKIKIIKKGLNIIKQK